MEIDFLGRALMTTGTGEGRILEDSCFFLACDLDSLARMYLLAEHRCEMMDGAEEAVNDALQQAWLRLWLSQF